MFDLGKSNTSRLEPDVYHLVNPHTTSWSEILDKLKAAGLKFEVVPTAIWLERLEAIEGTADSVPCLAMRDFWKTAVSLPQAL